MLLPSEDREADTAVYASEQATGTKYSLFRAKRCIAIFLLVLILVIPARSNAGIGFFGGQIIFNFFSAMMVRPVGGLVLPGGIFGMCLPGFYTLGFGVTGSVKVAKFIRIRVIFPILGFCVDPLVKFILDKAKSAATDFIAPKPKSNASSAPAPITKVPASTTSSAPVTNASTAPAYSLVQSSVSSECDMSQKTTPLSLFDSTTIKYQDRVKVASTTVAVRETASSTAIIFGVQPKGFRGSTISTSSIITTIDTVISTTTTITNQYKWWKVDFDGGFDGWVLEDGIVTPAPPALTVNCPIDGMQLGSTTVGIVYQMDGDFQGYAITGPVFQLDARPIERDYNADGKYQFINVVPGTHTMKGWLEGLNYPRVPGTDIIITFTVGDFTPPTIALTAPRNSDLLSGVVNVSANASDDVGVVGVQFKLDGANLGAEDITAPYAFSWDTRAIPKSLHVLSAVARDLAGNTATVGSITVTTQ